MAAAYDVFVSHAWADGDRPQQITEALGKAGLRVWFDAKEINDFVSITHAVTEGLAQSKALIAYYSKTYPLRRACQWELTAAFLAAQAEGDSRRRVLVVNPEDKADHIHPIELRDAKFRVAPTDNGPALDSLVQSLVKHVATLKVPLADIRQLSAPSWYGMNPVGSTRFVGRLKEMWELHSLLHAGDVPQVSYATAATGGIGQVRGLGGVGKSLLAEEYALNFGSAYPGGIFWLRAYGNDGAKSALETEAWEAERASQVQTMAEGLGVNTHGLSAAQIQGALRREIERRGLPCLWVVDDVPNGLDGEALRRWFAPHALARTLITTRSCEYGSLANSIDLCVLAPDEAYQLLASRGQPAGEAEEEQARLLAEDLGHHALALDVTASALVSYGADEPFRKFRDELAGQQEDALELARDLAEALPNGHEASIAQTMLRSVRNLGAEGQDFLRLASVLAVAPIPASLVTAVFEATDDLESGKAEQNQRKAFHAVTQASLAETSGEHQDARAVHPLVSRTVRFREKSSPKRTEALRTAAVVALSAAIATAAEDPRSHKQIELQVAHGRQVVSTPATANEAALVGWVGRYEHVRGAYASARVLFERELAFRGLALGLEHPDTLTSMSNLALTLRAQGYLAEARELQQETLEISLRALGPEHRNTLSAMNNLAEMLRAHGDLAGARKLQEDTLEIQRRVLGPEHRNTLVSMSNLAGILSAQGDLAGARKLQEDTLEIRRRVLPPEDPHTLMSMNNMAETLRAHGDLAGARKLQEDTLEIQRRVLGPEHRETLASTDNLASTLRSQGDLEGARRLQQETVGISRRVLGPEHPDTLVSMSELAETLRAQGDLAGARKLQEDTLEVRRRVLRPEHPDTSVSAWNLYHTLNNLSECAAARAVLERDLLWLLDRDPATLSAHQRTFREYVTKLVKKNG